MSVHPLLLTAVLCGLIGAGAPSLAVQGATSPSEAGANPGGQVTGLSTRATSNGRTLLSICAPGVEDASTNATEPVGPEKTETDTSISVEAAWRHVDRAVAMVDRMHRTPPSSRLTPKEAFTVDCSIPRPDAARAVALSREARHARREIGLDLEGRYGQETAVAAGGGEFGGGISGTFVGLEWDLLSAGLWQSRWRDDLLETRAKAKRLRESLTTVQRRESCRSRRVPHHFDAMDRSLSSMRIELGETYQQRARRSYLNGNADLERLIEAQSQLTEVRQHLQALRARTERPRTSFQHFPPLWTLDFEALRNTQRGDSLRRRLADAQREEVRLQNRLSWDARLSTFGRYRFDRLSLQDSGWEFGLRVQYPVSSFFDADGVAANERLQVIRRDERLDLGKKQRELDGVQNRFESARRGALRAHYRAMEYRERVRRQLVRHARDSTNGQLGRALSQAQLLLSTVFAKMEGYRETYATIARAFRAAREPFDPSLLRAGDLHPLDWRGRSGKRALYVWSESLRTHSPTFLLDLAQAREIDRFIVSAGRQTPPKTLRRLRAQARQEGIRVERLLAVNDWARPGGVEEARKRLSAMDLDGDVLHLDVEPHALDRFDQHREAMLNRYVDLLRVAGKATDDGTLAVSVPLFWPERIYRQISNLVDRAYLMAYGEMAPRERAGRAMEVARLLDPEQRAVALRTQDFANEWALEQTVSAMEAVVGTERVAIHDLDSFLELVGRAP